MSEPRRRVPVRALFWKEWRQLRLVRLVGGVSCALVPALLLAAAELGLVGLRGYDLRGVVVDAAPRVLASAWTLLSLFVTVQAFLGDRASGADLFLLTMPVRRRWVFWSRVAASAGSSAAIALTSVAAWLVWVLSTVGPGALPGEWTGSVLRLGGLGILVGLASGIGAMVLVSLPLGAVLAGLVLGVVPLFLGAILMGIFPDAVLDGAWDEFQSVGFDAALLLFPAFVAVSFGMLCFGEPAGRGRWRRAATWFSGALGIIGVLFVSLASYSTHGGSYRLGHPEGSASHPLAYFSQQTSLRSRGWLVDMSSERVLRQFPGVLAASWSTDGRYLAVSGLGAALGRRLRSGRVEIYDAERSESRFVPIEDPRFRFIKSPTWTRTHLLLESWTDSSIAAVSLEDWTVSVPPLPTLVPEERFSALVTSGGERYLAIEIIDARSWGRTIGLHRLHLETGAVDPAPAFELELSRPRDVTPGLAVTKWEQFKLEWDLAWRASPSGRFWVSGDPKLSGLSLLDTETSARIRIEFLSPKLDWLAGDTLVWVEPSASEGPSMLRAWDAPRGARDLGPVAPGHSLRLVPSPDLRKLLVLDPPRSGDIAARVLDLASETWSDLAGACPAGALDKWKPWAAPDVLVCRDAKHVATFHRLEPRYTESPSH